MTVVPFGAQRLRQKPATRHFQVRAGFFGKKEGEGEEPSQQKVSFRFTNVSFGNIVESVPSNDQMKEVF